MPTRRRRTTPRGPRMNIRELKRMAKRDGINWSEVEEFAAGLIQAATDAALNDHAIRREVYQQTCPRGKQHMPFWKAIGQWDNPRYNGAFGGGKDWTVIRRWDEIAHSLSEQLPELNRTDDACQALYDLICSPPLPIPSRREALNQAIELICGESLREIRERQNAIPF